MNELFVAMVLNAAENFAALRAEQGKTIPAKEAELFAKNYMLLLQALLSSGLEIKVPPESR